MEISEYSSERPLVSVIVPIYNVEPYLGECLDSLCEQTLKNIEIIGIDDGCTDGSGALLDEYAAKDKRITAVHQGHAGVSVARNKGMNLAKGEYIAFVDGDDWMERTAYEDMLQKLQGKRPDIVIFQNFHFDDGMVYGDFDNETLVRENLSFDELISLYGAQVTTKLFKRRFIREADVSFVQGIILGEDTLFCSEILTKTESVILLGKCYYYYRMFRPKSTMSTNFSLQEVLKMITAMKNRPFYHQMDSERRMIIDLSNGGGLLYRFSLTDKDNKVREVPVLEEFLSYLEQTYGREKLASRMTYINMCRTIKEKDFSYDKLSFLQKIFSVKNSKDKRYKVVRILGMVLQIKRKYPRRRKR